MAFFYVKSGGTATGDAGRYASKQTGSFAGLGAAGYYGSIAGAEAATTSPTGGDFILVSDAHSFTDTVNITYTGVTTGAPYLVMAVSDAAIDSAPSSRAVETINSTSADFQLNNSGSFKNIELSAGDNFQVGVGSNYLFDSCKLILTGSGDSLVLGTDGASFHMRNSELAMNGTTAAIVLSGGCSLEVFGGSITTTTGGVTNLISGSGVNAGMAAHFDGVDLSAITGTLLAGVGASRSVDDRVDVTFDRCKLASGVAFVGEDFDSFNQRAVFTRCSNVSAEAEYQYYLKTFSGEVFDDDVIRRADDEPFTDSATDISFKAVTNSKASAAYPLWFDFPTPRWSELSAGASDTFRIYVASTSALTSQDVWIEAVYPDGTTKELANFVTSAGFELDLDTLTTDSGSDWRNGASALAGHNEYQIDLSTAGDAGADCYPSIRVYVAKASTTVYVASDIGLV